MKLSREFPGNKTYVRAAGEEGIRIGDDYYLSSIIITPDAVDADWNVNRFSDLSVESLERLLQYEPELVIVGTGDTQHFPSHELLLPFYNSGTGVEFMTTAAACRTFNILVVEERNVVAGLIQPGR